MMTQSEFDQLAAAGHNRIPLVLETFADLDTPLSVYLKLAHRPFTYLLESVVGGERFGRYSFIGLAADVRFEVRGHTCAEYAHQGLVRRTEEPDPPAFVQTCLARYRAATLPGLPRFCGGAVGYLGYDAARWFEKVPSRSREDLGLPDAVFMFGDVVSVFHNLTHTLKVVTHARGGDDPGAAYDAAVSRAAS